MGGSPTSSKDIPSGGNPNVDPLPIDDGWVEAGIHPQQELVEMPDLDVNFFLGALPFEVGDDDEGWEEAGIHP